MTRKTHKNLREYEQVKYHYENAARNRAQRLQNGDFNPAKLNHHVRFRVITRLLRQIDDPQKGIDIGTGTGVWAEVLADYCREVVGIDFAANNIEIAKQQADKKMLGKRIAYILGDAQRLDKIIDHNFDVATHISVLQHLPDQKMALQRANDILKKNGKLIILVHNRRCIYNRNLKSQVRQGTVPAINEYMSLSEIKAMLRAAGFQIKQIRLCWICVNDFLTLGQAKPLLRPIMPLRKCCFALCNTIAEVLSRFHRATPLFREIVILVEKEPAISKRS